MLKALGSYFSNASNTNHNSSIPEAPKNTLPNPKNLASAAAPISSASLSGRLSSLNTLKTTPSKDVGLTSPVGTADPAELLNRSVGRLASLNPALPTLSILSAAGELTRPVKDSAAKKFQDFILNSGGISHIPNQAEIKAFQKELVTFNSLLKESRNDLNSFDFSNLKIETAVAILNASGLDDLKPEIAGEAKARVLSPEQSNQTFKTPFIGHIKEIVRHSPISSRDELIQLLDRMDPYALVQALVLADLPNSQFSREDVSESIKQVYDGKSSDFKGKAANALKGYLKMGQDRLDVSPQMRHCHDLPENVKNHVLNMGQ